MTGYKEIILVFALVCLFIVKKGLCSQEELENMSKAFANVLEECKKEENVGDHVMQDLSNFWHEEYQLVNRELGCLMLCMASKLELLDEDSKMHHDNAQEFAEAHGADDALAKQLVTMAHECEKEHEGIEDKCTQALETAKCFRTKIHALDWTPEMEGAIEESKAVIEEALATM